MINCDELDRVLILCSHRFRLNIKDRYKYYKEQTEKYLYSLSFFQNIRLFAQVI